jgi:hypothetical protein
VQFACNSCGIYAHNGHNGQFFNRILDRIDAIDTMLLGGRRTTQLLIRRLQVRVPVGVSKRGCHQASLFDSGKRDRMEFLRSKNLPRSKEEEIQKNIEGGRFK